MTTLDERGWQIPPEGSRNRRIYDLVVEGKRPSEIASILSMKANLVNQVIFQFRHPGARKRKQDAAA